VRKSLFCIPLVSLCSLVCLPLTGCGGGGSVVPPPAAVTGLGYSRTSDDPGRVQLAWTPGSSRTTRGYLVARRLPGETTFTRLTTMPITTPAYTDRLPAGEEIVLPTYRVVAVDRKERTGTPAEVQAVISPPAPPF
jgi:hypothetical protein